MQAPLRFKTSSSLAWAPHPRQAPLLRLSCRIAVPHAFPLAVLCNQKDASVARPGIAAWHHLYRGRPLLTAWGHDGSENSSAVFQNLS